jgi:hypothetical protein
MTPRLPLFVELCCGSAAVTLRLLGGPNARPPISYMGSKRGYAAAILAVLGLRSGQGADACVLVEAGPWARAWRLLTTPEGCKAVAAVIRGWVGEDARALWERLRAEPVPEGEAEAVGAWLAIGTNTVGCGGAAVDGGRFVTAGGFRRFTDEHGENTKPVDPALLPSILALLSSLRWPPVQVVEGDVCGVEPREVAAWLYINEASFRRGDPDSGFDDTQARHERGTRGACLSPQERIAPRLDDTPSWPPVVVSNAPVEQVQPGTLPPGTVAFFDPPYQGTTGYQHTLSRSDVLIVAQRWADAGVTVCVSEAEPLPLPGWHHVEITGCRVGQKRTFSKQQREWLTLNREPAWLPETQGCLFGEVG